MTGATILALPAGRATDRLVADALGDRLGRLRQQDGWWHSTDGSKYADEDGGPRRYTADVTAAWRVMEALRESGSKPVIGWNGHTWDAAVIAILGPDVWVPADTAPLAICRAFLLAVSRRTPVTRE